MGELSRMHPFTQACPAAPRRVTPAQGSKHRPWPPHQQRDHHHGDRPWMGSQPLPCLEQDGTTAINQLQSTAQRGQFACQLRALDADALTQASALHIQLNQAIVHGQRLL